MSNEYELRKVAVVLVKRGNPIFDESATEIRIADEGAGEYLEIRQCAEGAELGTIKVDADEWQALRMAVDSMAKECRE